MSSIKELQTRNDDLLTAMQAVGDLLADESVPVKRRVDMALGVLWRYDCAKKPNGKADA